MNTAIRALVTDGHADFLVDWAVGHTGKTPTLPIGDNLPLQSERSFLSLFEPPPQSIEPAVRACRLFNTALDVIFYNVPTLAAQLADKHARAASSYGETAFPHRTVRCTQ